MLKAMDEYCIIKKENAIQHQEYKLFVIISCGVLYPTIIMNLQLVYKSLKCISHCEVTIYILFICIVKCKVLVNEMPKSARYHIDRANSIVFTSKRLPLQAFHPRGIG